MRFRTGQIYCHIHVIAPPTPATSTQDEVYSDETSTPVKKVSFKKSFRMDKAKALQYDTDLRRYEIVKFGASTVPADTLQQALDYAHLEDVRETEGGTSVNAEQTF